MEFTFWKSSKVSLRMLSMMMLQLLVMMMVMEVISSVVECMTIGPERYTDISFPATNIILNHTVTCGKFKPGQFIARTFTCSDIRVDGHKLAYGYYSGWAVGTEAHMCQETNGVHEFGHLCVALLTSFHKDSLGFRAVYVPHSTCSYINETRKLLKKMSKNKFEWQDFHPGWGWTDTIQCMTSWNNS